jgi:uncharacterized 2Fe-2S/4Fe-4S cluster protein (DUF4445 family)
MPDIAITQTGNKLKISVDKGAILQQVLRKNGVPVYSPCGGNGTCGKCKVFIKGEGYVTSCVYLVNEDIEITLPDQREANILVDQHAYTVQITLNPGPSCDLSFYPHGVAIDIGTTSVVFYLVNLFTGSIIETRAVINPQAKYGADVISRINFSAESQEGLSILQKEILTAINIELDHFAAISGIPADEIVKIAISGNTTMLHLLLGVDPLPIALAPFIPGFIEEQRLKGKDLTLHCHPEAEIKVLPSISAYVGADIVAGIASIKSMEQYKRYLFMDIGTNGEMALITPERIWCCATAAGPAFEGANISCGMSAVEGAINVFTTDGYSVIGNFSPVGICGSGLIDVVAYLVENKIVSSDGFLEKEFIVVPKEYSGTSKELVITQQDIREVQLAKSAMMAGLKVLLKKAGLTFDDIDVLFLAGGFGNYIDTRNAIKIGMLPESLANRIISLGNTSGAGALLALKSVNFDSLIGEVRQKAYYVELSDDEDFTLDFVMNMGFDKSGS